MDNSETSIFSHFLSHFELGDCIHRGTHNRDVKWNILGESRDNFTLASASDVAILRDHEDIIEREAHLKFRHV